MTYDEKLKITREVLKEVAQKTGNAIIRCNSVTLLSYLPIPGNGKETEEFLIKLNEKKIQKTFNGKPKK